VNLLRWACPALVLGAVAAPDRRPPPSGFEAPAGARAVVPQTPARFALSNSFAYIPPQCWTKTRGDGGAPASNPCYACHTRGTPPNFVDDADLQRTLSLPAGAAENPWTNVLDPPFARTAPDGDLETLEYVRRSNYFDDHGALRTLGGDGYQPDAWFAFDEQGFDHRPDGSLTGWRAFAYHPFLGTFFPTNGSADDVLVRLDPAFQESEAGTFDRATYVVNLAIVEALVTRADVAVDPVDERSFGVDLDGDGKLGRATRVAFGLRMQYVGKARMELAAGRLTIAPGLLPASTEFLHSVRYLDVGPDGRVTMAPRMKELRYARKLRWLSPVDLGRIVAREAAEARASPDGVEHFVPSPGEGSGIYNGKGWLFQGYIEDAAGDLRPQSYEESVACAGCHGGIGATTDSVFALPRKLPASSLARGWYHWTRRGLGGIPERRAAGGAYEYTRYLEANHAGDELRENDEVQARFFDEAGALRPSAVARLHEDIGTLLLPSPTRALDLDRAYRAIVRAQTFVRGRDAVLSPPVHVYARAPVGESTGIAP
jgi:hypothetical protein